MHGTPVKQRTSDGPLNGPAKKAADVPVLTDLSSRRAVYEPLPLNRCRRRAIASRDRRAKRGAKRMVKRAAASHLRQGHILLSAVKRLVRDLE